MKKIGIYMITDTKENKAYLGQSDDIARRASCHFSKAKGQYHEYKELNEAYRNGGKDRLKFEILEECSRNELNDREKFWFKYMKQVDSIEVINKTERTHTKSKVKDTSRMCKAQQSVNNPRCRLSKQDIFNILDMVEQGIKRKDIAEQYNISENYISRIGKDRRIEEYKEYYANKEKDATKVASA